MKKFLALSALVLGMVSCQTEPEGFDVNVGGEQDVNITVSLPEGTRANSALGAFENVDLINDYDVRFQCEVHYGTEKKVLEPQFSDNGTEASFNVRLIANRNYTFVVWADLVKQGETEDLHYNTANGLTNITLNNTWVAMDETRDAFTCSEVREFKRNANIRLELKRPFAKMRVITTDMLELMGVQPTTVEVEYTTNHFDTYNALTKTPSGELRKQHVQTAIAAYDYEAGDENKTLFTDYFFATETQKVVNFNMNVYDQNNELIDETKSFNTPIPTKRNYVTTIKGNILTYADDFTVEILPGFDGEEEVAFVEVESANDLVEAIESAEAGEETIITLVDNISLNDLLSAGTLATRAAADPTVTIKAGRVISLNLNGLTLSATSTQTGKNYNMFDVQGTLSLANGTIEYKHEGENMGWNSSTNLFNVTAGGVLNLEGVTAKNLGGSDMGFVAHLNNWGKVTLNVENSTLESNYVAVRVFNSGPDMNNVTIKNSTLKGNSAAFWVHNYTVEDFGTEAKAEAQKALLNLNIYKQGNTFSPDVNGIRYGFTNAVRTDAYGITKVVSEDGTEVTLGTIFENNTVRRYVAGTEENTTIKKVIVEEGIAVLYDRTFRRFYALEEVVLPSTLTTIGAAGTGVFQSCNNLKTIVLPESLTVLGKGSFQECTSLESINIPAGVTRIESDALRNTGLKSVEFHAGVTYFGAQAFRDCKQLTEVTIKAPEFTMENNTFGIMAAPFTPMTINVANAEMKAYVESMLTAHAKTYITVKAPVAVTDKASLQAAMADAIKAGEKNIFIDGTNFSGDLNYGFSNANLPAGVTVTIRNAKVTATSKWNYLNGTLIFEDCEFTAGLYSIHFDDNDGVGDVVFKNCKLVGWLPFAAINSVTFEDCHLTGNGSYALIRSYANLTLKNCVIDTTNANHNDEYSDGVQAIAPATLTEENVTYIDNHTAYLQNVLKAGKNVVLSSDLTINEGEMMTAPYGNKMALHHNGGLFDGNNKTLSVTIGGDNYAVMTSGGTIKDLTVDNGFRGILIMSAKETINLENVVSSGEGVCYALNTAEGDSTQDLVATNCTFDGWSSWSLLKSATFTNCKFGQGTYYTNVYGRLGKPYVTTVFEGCDFCSKYYLDLSALGEGHKVTLKNCTVNGMKITANNWTRLVAPEDTCDDGQISVELKNGTYLTASNVADYIIFE